MPDTKRIQGPEESQSPLLYLKSAEKDARERRSLVRVQDVETGVASVSRAPCGKCLPGISS